MKQTTTEHGIQYHFDNGYSLSVISGWAAMGDEEHPYEFMAWGNGKETDAIGYQTEEDINKIVSIFNENNTELIDKFFSDYSLEEPYCPEPPVPMIAVVTTYMGTEYDNTESTVYWKVRYLDANSGELLEDMTLKGQFNLEDEEGRVPSHEDIGVHAYTCNPSAMILAVHRF